MECQQVLSTNVLLHAYLQDVNPFILRKGFQFDIAKESLQSRFCCIHTCEEHHQTLIEKIRHT